MAAIEDEDVDELDGPPVETVADYDVSQEERFKLWVAAGARCAFCKTYLLESEETGDPTRIGEMAHIVGRTTSARSPRGQDPLPAPSATWPPT